MFASARLIDRTSGRPQPGIPLVPRLRHSTRPLAACTDGMPCAPCLLDERKPFAATGVARMAIEEASRSPGRPLGTAERQFFEPRFGHSFADVRIHTGPGPAAAAGTIGAAAYTVGSDIVFGAGRYAPDTAPGRRLLAHELAHTIQPGPDPSLAPAAPWITTAADPAEEEASAAAEAVLAGGVADLRSPATAPLRRSPDEPGGGSDLPPVRLPEEPRGGSGVDLPKDYTGCSIIWKKGKVYWQCQGAGLPKTPEIPLDPRDIPGEIGDLFPKDKPPKGDVWIPVPRVPDDFCKDHPVSPLCLFRPPGPTKPPTPSAPVAPPTGIFWTDSITFLKDRPNVGESDPAATLTPEGVKALDSVIGLLKLEATTQVRLIGHASSEGTEEPNLQLGKRRVLMVKKALEAAGLGSRIASPVTSDGKEAGCSKIDFGMWSCGEVGSTQGEVRPEERRVDATYLRNPTVTLPLPPLTVPEFKFRGRTSP